MRRIGHFSYGMGHILGRISHELLSPLERKSIEPIALHLSGEKYVRPMQKFLSRSPFDESAVHQVYQKLLSTQIGEGRGMLSVDDTSFVKKGKHSAGVKRQYCSLLGKTENCQSGVFLAYAEDKGYGLVDCELYLPREWYHESYTQLRLECHIPQELLHEGNCVLSLTQESECISIS